MTKKIVLVGNGPSVLDQKLGAVIDEFPEIVRFNGFVLEGFEAQIGTRTTTWSRWYALPIKRFMDQFNHIWLNMPVHERTEAKLAQAYALLGEHSRKTEVIPALQIAFELQRSLFGGPHPTLWPSSGLLAIVHAVHQGYDVSIAGFDSWTKEPFHYYGSHDRTDTHHVAELEREYISRLRRDGKVRLLENRKR